MAEKQHKRVVFVVCRELQTRKPTNYKKLHLTTANYKTTLYIYIIILFKIYITTSLSGSYTLKRIFWNVVL